MKRHPPVVIVRKQKRLHPIANLVAFGLTGGTSAIYTGAKAATNARYNQRTRRMARAHDEEELMP